jgi:ferredoxin
MEIAMYSEANLDRETATLRENGGSIMRVSIDDDLCAGSGVCVDLCPEMFERIDNIARAKGCEIPDRLEPACREAMRQCPMGAIRLEA